VLAVAAAALLSAGCGGIQSALDPAGRAAERIAGLFWWMAASAAVIWAAVIGLAIYAIHLQPASHSRRASRLLIVGGGAVVPTLVLGVLLAYGLAMLPDLVAPAPEGSLRIAVTGEQWWWRVRYLPPGGPEFELANEIRLPIGEPVQFELEGADVVHSFWIPSLGGKTDMIPGRRTRLSLEPTRTGVLRGACAEYCGASHALMAFYAVVVEKGEFGRWMERQAQVARQPAGASAERGRGLFLANGCGACHTIRGTPARGAVGPDLTHVGSRLSIGAGTFPKGPDALVRWIARTKHAKPGARMPPFGMLPQEDLRALAAYLDGLE
jgi:cytochrome c oxidase subunit 2